MVQSGVQYVTTSDGVSIAYVVRGEGYPVIHMQGQPFTHVQAENHLENYARYNQAVGHNRRAIRFDTRGSGLSQRGIPEFTLDGITEDLIAVADRLELERFAIVGTQAGGLIALNAYRRMPERVSHIAFLDAYPSGVRFGEIPQVRAFMALGGTDWELFTESLAHSFFGWDAGKQARDYAKFLRECVNQDEAMRMFNALFQMDLTDMLPTVKIPTVVLHHSRSIIPDMEAARLLASRLPQTELVLLRGYWNDSQDDLEVVDAAITKLLGGDAARPPSATATRAPSPGGLVTILFTDVEGSTALTQRLGDVRARELFRKHERITREALAAHGGSEVKTMGDGFMASFGSASGALECAIALERAFAEHNATAETPVNVRIGLNAGEPIAEEEDLFGTAVITAARIAAQAKGGEILVSNVVRELVAGRGFMFADRGEALLRGFEDPVRIFEVRWREP
jgi:class 3 adenylate cyclase